MKNVGEGPVQLIIDARKGGPFTDLNDFARRVDLRAVGKRAIENSHQGWCARQPRSASGHAGLARPHPGGQRQPLPCGGGRADVAVRSATGVQAETITLPENIKVDRKEMLNWERELIGLYLSDHPLSGHTELLTKAVSHNSITLNDAAHEERVRVAGMVAAVRPYKTKTDKMMGFVTIEDMQGTVELVIFPKTWDKTRALCEQGKVIVVDGKVDFVQPAAEDFGGRDQDGSHFLRVFSGAASKQKG